MNALPPDCQEPGPLPVRRSTRRFAFATAIAVWSLYLAMAGVRCLAYGFRYPPMLMERHGLTALVAVALSFCVYAVLDRQRTRELSKRLALGSGLVDHSRKMTVAASAMAEKKAVGQRS